VVAKAEHLDGKENPRFIITSLSSERGAPQALYEDLYCGRGDMENRIKEQFSLFADRVSAETMRANQMRLYLSVMAYVLMSGLRRRVSLGHFRAPHEPPDALHDPRHRLQTDAVFIAGVKRYLAHISARAFLLSFHL